MLAMELLNKKRIFRRNSHKDIFQAEVKTFNS